MQREISMNNAAIVCPIQNVRSHSNADRVQLGTACGYQVVIGLDVKEGDLGIYFPTDTCLGNDFARHNEALLAYFGKNRRVRTQKFRGEKSEGFWASYDHFAKCFDPVTHAEAVFNVGDEITTTCGVEICTKYVNPETLRRRNIASKVAKKFRSGSLPTFQKHVETEHLRKEWGRIPRDRQWIWTTKQHGTCLLGRSRVRMADGSIKRMNDVVVGDIVASKDGPAEVLDTMVYEPPHRWVRVDAHAYSGERSKLVCTPDHLIWTNLGWVEADDLDPTIHSIAVSKMQLCPTDIQRSFHNGKLLGDGHYNNHLSLSYSHKEDHKEYVDFCRTGFGNLHKSEDTRTSGYGTIMLRSLNKVTRFLGPNVEELNPLSLAIWYMDDGSLAHSEVQQDRANIAVCRYDDQQIQHLLGMLSNIGLHPIWYKDSEGYNRFRFNHQVAEKMFTMIRPFVPDIMQYKLPEHHRGYFKPVDYQTATQKSCVWFTDDFTVEEYSYRRGEDKKRYDIETTTGSFIANNIVVHNSARVANSCTTQELTWWQKLLQRVGVSISTTRYEYLIGSRNVILGELKADGSVGKDNFYSDEFRRKAAKPFLGQLHKGEVVYYEIVGYAAFNTPIMSTVKVKDKDIKKIYGDEVTYTYGCHNGGFDIYVYRVAYQTEDGKSVDLSWDQVKQRCAELGVKHVPEVDPDIQALWNNVDNPIDFIQDYIAQPDPTDDRHPMEGVVLRVEGSTPEFYKEKAFIFKVLEGIAADQGVVDTEEAS